VSLDRLLAMIRNGAVAAMLASILLGCGTSTPSPVDVSGAWQLTGGTVDGGPFPVLVDAPFTLSVTGAAISGRSPCNHYGGEIVVDSGGSRFEMTSMTEMACEERVMAAEAIFVAALPRVRGATRDGDRLTLTGPGVELTFEHLAPPPLAAMVERDWVLESLLATDVVVSVAGDPAALRFEPGGTFRGSTGCRMFSGTWATENGGISPVDLGMAGACPAELAHQDGHIVGVLEGFRASVDGQQLTLTGQRGEGLIYRTD
jgi:heat shock protein HslJ